MENEKLSPWTKIEAGVADIMPGYKTLTLAGGLAAFNLLDYLQSAYQAFSPALEHLIPAPYLALVNVAVPAVIMWLRNISGRTEDKIQTKLAELEPVPAVASDPTV